MWIWVVGALTFHEVLTTGRWEKWRICFVNYNPWLLEGKWRTFGVGEKARMTNFQSDFFIASRDPFPFSIIWRLCALVRVLFLLGKRLGADFWLLTS